MKKRKRERGSSGCVAIDGYVSEHIDLILKRCKTGFSKDYIPNDVAVVDVIALRRFRRERSFVRRCGSGYRSSGAQRRRHRRRSRRHRRRCRSVVFLYSTKPTMHVFRRIRDNRDFLFSFFCVT